MNITATYSPDDNKLRLTASARLDADTYARVKAAGFAWAPKLGQFIAPMWTPARADLCIELAGRIDDDDGSLIERAEDRAERFEDYQGKRAAESARALDYVHQIADGIPFGQPIMVGHHSERHARKDAERIQAGMRRAVQLFDTAEYWKRRAAAAIAHAKYKERPDVRHRRIKGIEADARKVRANIEEAHKLARIWSKVPRYEWDDQTAAALYIAGRVRSFGGSLYGPLRDGTMHGDTAWRIAVAAAEAYATGEAARWLEHYENRLAYERAMLADAGGIVADRFDLQPGGTVTHRGRRSVILRVNRSGGQAVSVSVTGQGWTVGVEEITAYEPPSEAAAEAAAAIVKRAPLANYPGRGFLTLTRAQWDEIGADYKTTRDMGAGVDATNGGRLHDSLKEYRAGSEVYSRHRVRVAMGVFLRRAIGPEAWAAATAGRVDADTQRADIGHGMHPVYITDAKLTEPARLDAPPKAPRRSMARKIAEAAGVDTSAQPEAAPLDATGPAPQYTRGESTGRLYRVLATFDAADEAGANAYMAAHEGAGVLKVEGGTIYLADRDDMGTATAPGLEAPPAAPPVCELTAAKRAARAVVAELTAPVRRTPPATQSAPPAGDSQAAKVEALRQSLRAGVQVVSAPQLFPTPPDLAARMVELAGITPASRVLEPSAGTGRLVDAIMRQVPAWVDAVEVNRSLADALQARHAAVRVKCADFLALEPAPGQHDGRAIYDAIVMNPPFANGADVDHVTHALHFLAPGGRLVAIMSAGVTFRDDRKTREFRRLVAERGGTIDDLPPDTFASEGTGVRTVLVVVDAPGRRDAEPTPAALEVPASPAGADRAADLVETLQGLYRDKYRARGDAHPEFAASCAVADLVHEFKRQPRHFEQLLSEAIEDMRKAASSDGAAATPAAGPAQEPPEPAEAEAPASPAEPDHAAQLRAHYGPIGDHARVIAGNVLRKRWEWSAEGIPTAAELGRAAASLEAQAAALAADPHGEARALAEPYRAAATLVRQAEAEARADEEAQALGHADAAAAWEHDAWLQRHGTPEFKAWRAGVDTPPATHTP